jgi:hypothetical protein
MRISALVRKASFKLRHRDLYDDARQDERLRAYTAHLRGKTIAVVGNAQSLFAQAHGADIDAHDIVLRFNMGFVTDPARQGQRTDILALACELPLAEIRRRYGHPQIVWVTPLRELMAPDLAADRADMLVVPLAQWEDLHQAMNGARPSAGAITIDWLRTRAELKTLSLFGFDWKATKTFYHDQSRAGWHDWGQESRMVQAWAAADSRIVLHGVNAEAI